MLLVPVRTSLIARSMLGILTSRRMGNASVRLDETNRTSSTSASLFLMPSSDVQDGSPKLGHRPSLIGIGKKESKS